MGFIWVEDISVGALIEAADWNEVMTNIESLYTALGKDYPGCSGPGWVTFPVTGASLPEEEGDEILSAHPVELRTRIDYLADNLCGADYVDHDVDENVGANTGEDFGEDVGAHSGEDTSEDSGDYVSAQEGEDTSEDVGADSGAFTGENIVERSGVDFGANTGEDTEELVGANTGEEVGAEGGVFVGADSEADPVHDGLHDHGLCIGDDVGAFSGDEDSNWLNNDIWHLEIVLVADMGCPGYCALVRSNDH